MPLNNVYNMVMQHLEELTPREKLRILFCYRKGNGDEYIAMPSASSTENLWSRFCIWT